MVSTQTAYVVTPQDNVATALGDISTGKIQLTGTYSKDKNGVSALQKISFGHKIALCAIGKGEPIIKYGCIIGLSTTAISKGEHVHLHNMKSCYDQRAETFDIETTSSTDMEYKLY